MKRVVPFSTLLLALCAFPASAILDTNSNGLSDLWERAYNRGDLFPSMNPLADDDGDGWTNEQEAAAGTNPFDPNAPDGFIHPEIVHIPAVWIDTDLDEIPDTISTPEAITVTWPTIAGKQYTLLYSPNLTEWLSVEDWTFIGSGSIMEYNFTLAQDDKLFWRVKVEDVDSDGDGLTDAEENVLGTDPNISETIEGISDLWLASFFYDSLIQGELLLIDPDADPDGDGLSNLQESQHNTNPFNADTDGDWMWDDYEIDRNLDPTDPVDGMLDADGDSIPNQLEFVFLDEGYDPFTYNNPSAFPWTGDPDGDGLSTQVEISVYHTNPQLYDTDGDMLPDGWEVLYGLDPLQATGVNGADGDPDEDGVKNLDEFIFGPSPIVIDTDSDGADDATEIAQGSDPNNASDGGQAPAAEDIALVKLIVGDASESKSERYSMIVRGVEADTRTIKHQATEYGMVATQTYKLRKGAKYSVEIVHTGTNPCCLRQHGYSNYDSDWESDIQPDGDTVLVKKDPNSQLKKPIGLPNVAVQVAVYTTDLYIMKFDTSTQAPTPTDWERKRLGVGEVVFITVTPRGAGDITWTLANHQNSVLDVSDNYAPVFTAADSNCHPEVKADFGYGITNTINFEVVEPESESVIEQSDLSLGVLEITDQEQGVGMSLTIKIQPDDVSFANVQVRETAVPATNLTGYFAEPNIEDLGDTDHVPADWQEVNEDNQYGDRAGFSKWPKILVGGNLQWTTGQYEWSIPCHWRIDGKPEHDWKTRLQIHTIDAIDGTSTERKMERHTSRTPSS